MLRVSSRSWGRCKPGTKSVLLRAFPSQVSHTNADHGWSPILLFPAPFPQTAHSSQHHGCSAPCLAQQTSIHPKSFSSFLAFHITFTHVFLPPHPVITHRAVQSLFFFVSCPRKGMSELMYPRKGAHYPSKA